MYPLADSLTDCLHLIQSPEHKRSFWIRNTQHFLERVPELDIPFEVVVGGLSPRTNRTLAQFSRHCFDAKVVFPLSSTHLVWIQEQGPYWMRQQPRKHNQ